MVMKNMEQRTASSQHAEARHPWRRRSDNPMEACLQADRGAPAARDVGQSTSIASGWRHELCKARLFKHLPLAASFAPS